MSKAAHSMAALVALESFVGCASVYDGKYDWDAGWRSARVIQLGPGTTVPATSDDCRKDMAPADVARTVYAEVAYRSEGRWLRHRVVPIPEGVAVQDGETVYVNVASCDNALVKAARHA
jgi:hypothetical protein